MIWLSDLGGTCEKNGSTKSWHSLYGGVIRRANLGLMACVETRCHAGPLWLEVSGLEVVPCCSEGGSPQATPLARGVPHVAVTVPYPGFGLVELDACTQLKAWARTR